MGTGQPWQPGMELCVTFPANGHLYCCWGCGCHGWVTKTHTPKSCWDVESWTIVHSLLEMVWPCLVYAKYEINRPPDPHRRRWDLLSMQCQTTKTLAVPNCRKCFLLSDLTDHCISSIRGRHGKQFLLSQKWSSVTVSGTSILANFAGHHSCALCSFSCGMSISYSSIAESYCP